MDGRDEIVIVLRPYESFSSIDDIAIDEDWKHVQSFSRSEKRFMEEIWEVGDTDSPTVVRYIDDHFVIAIYVVVTGPYKENVADLIKSRIKNIPEEELWSSAEGDDAKAREQAIRFLAAIFPDEPSDRLSCILKSAAISEEASIRNAALLSIGRLAWPELWPIVEGRVNDESDPDVKRQAEALFNAYQKLVPKNN